MSEAPKQILETEWSHFWSIDEIKDAGVCLKISPNEEERARLCQRLNLQNIEKLEAALEIQKPKGQGVFHIQGHIDAVVEQSCVVSLEPVVSEIKDEFEAWYADPDSAVSIAKARHEKETEKSYGEVPMLEERDDPEPIVDGRIDLGELVTQYLSLSINPYPHAEGVDVSEYTANAANSEENAIPNPFAALKDWKDKLTDNE